MYRRVILMEALLICTMVLCGIGVIAAHVYPFEREYDLFYDKESQKMITIKHNQCVNVGKGCIHHPNCDTLIMKRGFIC